MDIFKSLLKETGNDYAKSVSEGIEAGDVNNYIDTGSYMLNALVSGSIFKGIPANKIITFAGEEATGKTYFVLGIIKKFLETDPRAGVFYFESESALTKDIITNRGIDTKRMFAIPVSTIQEFRTQALKILNKYIETPEEERQPIMMCLDSLGMLSTTKEVEDTAAGSETKDMTKAALIKGTFRVLTLKLGRANVPMLVTNHVYSGMSMYAGKEMSGGTGLKYSSSYVLYLSKSKEKDGTDVIGNVIHCKNEKSRLTIENKKTDVLLTYAEGLNKHYGLLKLAEQYGIFKRVGNRYELPDGTKLFADELNKNGEKHYTKEILEEIDKAAAKEFLYGSDQLFVPEETEEPKKRSKKPIDD